MTRVLFWNINNFGTNGFFPAPNAYPRSVGDDGEYGVPAAPADANDRLRVMLRVIDEAEPDLISIVEVKPGMVGPPAGTPLIDDACLELLLEIQNLEWPAAEEFRMVPPLASGGGKRAEGIAVYYRKDRLQFLGPWGFAGGVGGPIGEAPLALYPEPWGPTVALPNRAIPEGWPNAGRNERRLAGQFAFTNEGAAVNFPEAAHRKPWLTYFRDFSNEEAQRLIKLLSFHAPPGIDSVEGVDALADVQEIVPEALGANEVLCVVGDFNVSSLDGGEAEEAYGPLEEAGFTMRFDPFAAGVGDVLPQRAYYTTFIKRRQDSTPWVSDDEGAKVFGYPGFDYMSSNAIDNAFTRHGAGAGAPANMTILNPVTHSPYNAIEPPIEAIPPGVIEVESTMNEANVFRYAPPEEPGIDGYEEGADDATNEFQEWDNYTHIRSCSDHLPIALDI